MRMLRSPGALCRAVLLMTGLLCTIATDAGESPSKIRIIYTNDTHGALEYCP